MKKKYIHAKALPPRLPIVFTLALLLAMDVWKASQVWTGIFYALLALVWLCFLIEFVGKALYWEASAPKWEDEK